jgi:hypothetical protein
MGSQNLCQLRLQFICDLQMKGVNLPMISDRNAVHVLKNLVYMRDVVARLAKFTFDVLALFDSVPVLRPALE